MIMDIDEIKALRAENERLRLQLAACGVLSGCDTPEKELAKKIDRLEKIEKAAKAFCSKTLANSLAYWKYDREYIYLAAALDENLSDD